MKRVLYLGLDPARYGKPVYHLPLIQVVEKNLNDTCYKQMWEHFSQFSLVIFTSQNVVKILCNALADRQLLELLHEKKLICIGMATQNALFEYGFNGIVAKKETAEGVIELLQECLSNDNVLYLHSSCARVVIREFLKERGIQHFSQPIYDTELLFPKELPSLDEFEEIVFTSPSTVDAFLKIFKVFPKNISLLAIGPITKLYLEAVSAKDAYTQTSSKNNS
ncbi:MAG: uroporphyrinogen-III synthase [Chlamydiales bacterium]|nr:uroporphyrinogen-III synthase [Chlamydiales bacterium]